MSELKRKSLRGVRWTSFSAVIVAVGGLAQVFILTRLLEAGSFALMGIVNVAVGLANQLIDMGFSNAILREKNPGSKQLHTFYWSNVALGIFFASLIWFSAPFLAAFFPKLDPEKLVSMLHWICPAFILGAMAMQYQTLLQKSLQFKTLSIIETLAFVGGFGVTISMAILGYGAFSLVGGVLAKSLLSSVMLIGSGIGQHRPGLHFSWSDIKPVWKFGAFQSMEKLIAYFAINFDTLMITKLLSPSVSGVYEVVKRLLIQPWYVISPLVTKVTYPVMAQVHDDTPRLRNIALRSVQLVAVLNIPIYIGCAVGADLIVPTVFGAKWAEGIEPFRLLALSYLVRSVLNPLGSVILAKGKGQLAFAFQALSFLSLLAAISFGSVYGLSGMLLMLLGFNMLLIIPIHFFIARPLLESSARDLWNQVYVELFFSVLAFFLTRQVLLILPYGWISLGLYLALGGSLYLCAVLYFRPQLWQDFKQMLPFKV